jgi:hypothetical protein
MLRIIRVDKEGCRHTRGYFGEKSAAAVIIILRVSTSV